MIELTAEQLNEGLTAHKDDPRQAAGEMWVRKTARELALEAARRHRGRLQREYIIDPHLIDSVASTEAYRHEHGLPVDPAPSVRYGTIAITIPPVAGAYDSDIDAIALQLERFLREALEEERARR